MLKSYSSGKKSKTKFFFLVFIIVFVAGGIILTTSDIKPQNKKVSKNLSSEQFYQKSLEIFR